PHLDCLLLTSTSEGGGPMVVIEAMQHGVVPVASEFFGRAADELLQPQLNCLSFPVGDVQAAARQLNVLAADRGLLRKLSARARASVQERYERTSMQRGWLAALQDTLRLPARPVPPAPSKEVYGRLDRWAVSVSLADSIRRFLPQHSTAAAD